ncbi:tRNA (guanosine(46)-N7)-methyltransferase TrmB [Gammaproteobacteria bacterium]|jgi:tRNA (guanine-N7-)-methyltransferase|nr:tRNA (guanosine(46)-N7)-methyltransferase TrmB [Gammaproteobacteria bacterium]MDA7786530.1 tRNA (guanosine(46)-N7)-methyltransferase TrmB [Gammaproteobacteria bacterium]MDA7802354.1 tRNA (guanosine(46)-N7)-methyltransferase TrmB [Gammaproteobacteria bacterium]MDA7856662.1 tRNA (guanosine(46)-N7)-methyltransferase TrmB [Gammaproteobacteria bacterium]MDA8957750.1 tRNA (guanosine(46)-N7)-methyltransferase TrmB [Gammaproteobacteria bacterium]
MRLKYLPSFVKRRGRITKKQEENIEELINFSVSSINDIESESNGFKSIVIEIGFGDGENILTIAKENPDTLYIGSEVYLSGIGSLIGKIKENNLSNIRIYNNDARVLLDTIKTPIFDNMLIICPDPWQKARHHKRRLINHSFLELARKSLKANGGLYISTDWKDYAEGILEAINQAEGYIVLETQLFEDLPVTRFQARAIKEDREIFKFNLKKAN